VEDHLDEQEVAVDRALRQLVLSEGEATTSGLPSLASISRRRAAA
jgi:hypothetical protein